ncbi:hypothetical protein PFICI_13835 [Pestalotiopsis fici W106-1]|uniref:Xylanolytic transcriptional activator regulatory domain-containing protein n=1 Tax=Pestalotiopsis fici (strain W106-1 / CGMCC3.15140) TaxID=1229662 RepID=W3WJM1_PESFW|nr:uncharacterized protein PFICI_13835 [Pestalotiopsis fici W106-1]ETS73969.1 hypothetical protein PFICI_13835 [Pestalotiopsis fici W106-1]
MQCTRLEKQCVYPSRALGTNDDGAGDVPRGQTVPSGQADVSDSFQSLPSGGYRSGLSEFCTASPDSVPANKFPVLYFLDPEACIRPLPPTSRLSFDPRVSGPANVTPILEDDKISVCEEYFARIHPWLPILSKKVVRQNIQRRNITPHSSNLALLFHCMRLLIESLYFSDQGLSNPICPTYLLVKENLARAEILFLPDMSLLQSVILIATYETLHAIYPAAYLTIGHAARLGTMMGFHNPKEAPQLFKDSGTWTGREEERRACFVNQEMRSAALATPNPHMGEILPCTGTVWDEGSIGSNESVFSTSLSANITLGSFANVCQAAHLLGRVIHHRDDRDMDTVSRVTEANQLHLALSAFTLHVTQHAAVTLSPDSSIFTAQSLAFSARLVLYNIYACNERYDSTTHRSADEAELQRLAIQGILEVTESVSRLVRQILDTTETSQSPHFPNPFISHCLFQAAGECEWFVLENPESDSGRWLLDIVRLLSLIGERWQVAGVYVARIQEWPGFTQISESRIRFQ